MRYLNFLDGLRAIAICSVLLYHLNQTFVPNGYLGVDVFFVISGFIVSYSVANRPTGSSISFLLDFYARQFIRILPALVLCLLTTGVASFLFIPDAWLSKSQDETARAAFWGLSNIVLARGTDYFSPVKDYNPFAHTWSLGIEEQFYILFPLMFFPWMMSQKGRLHSLSAYGIALACSFVVWLHLTKAAPLQAFYLIHARFWQLSAGVVCFQASTLWRDKLPASEALWPAMTSLVVLGAAMFIKLAPQNDWMNNVWAAAATTFLIGSLLNKDLKGSLLAVLQAPPVKFLGAISYSLYLWHWPVFVIARWTFGLSSALQSATALVISLMLAIVSYYYVELPFRRSVILHRAPRYSVVVLGLTVVLGSWLSFDYLQSNKGAISLSTVMKNRDDWAPELFGNVFADTSGCTVREALVGVGIVYQRGGCSNSSASGKKIFFMGDSHAGAYINLVKRFTLVTGIESTLITTAGCPFLSLQLDRDNEPSCVSAVAHGMSVLMAEARAGDIVFLPSLRLPRLGEQFFQFTDEYALDSVFGPTRAGDRAIAIDNAVRVLRPLTERGVKILFEAPKPIFRSPSFRCSDWFNKGNPACKDGLTIEREFILKLRQPVIDGYAEIAERLPNIYVWDPLPVLCPSERCEALQGSKPLFFDGDHVSGYGNAVLAPSFIQAAIDLLSDASTAPSNPPPVLKSSAATTSYK